MLHLFAVVLHELPFAARLDDDRMLHLSAVVLADLLNEARLVDDGSSCPRFFAFLYTRRLGVLIFTCLVNFAGLCEAACAIESSPVRRIPGSLINRRA